MGILTPLARKSLHATYPFLPGSMTSRIIKSTGRFFNDSSTIPSPRSHTEMSNPSAPNTSCNPKRMLGSSSTTRILFGMALEGSGPHFVLDSCLNQRSILLRQRLPAAHLPRPSQGIQNGNSPSLFRNQVRDFVLHFLSWTETNHFLRGNLDGGAGGIGIPTDLGLGCP